MVSVFSSSDAATFISVAIGCRTGTTLNAISQGSGLSDLTSVWASPSGWRLDQHFPTNFASVARRFAVHFSGTTYCEQNVLPAVCMISVVFLPSCGLILVGVDGWVCSSNFRLQLQQLRVDCSICFSWHCLCTGPSSHHKLNDGCLSAVSLGMTEHLAVNYFVIFLACLRLCILSAMWRRPLCLNSSCDYVQRKFNWVVTTIGWLTGTAHSFWVLWHRT